MAEVLVGDLERTPQTVVIKGGIIWDAETGERIGMTDDATPAKTFDAAAHMRKIRTKQGMQDYLDVKWRVAWLRAEHPNAQVITEQIEGDETHARFKCTITLPNGAIGTGHGSETEKDFPDFYEKSETKALGRACAVLGYGTDAASDLDDGEPLDGRAAAKDERANRQSSPAPDGDAPDPVAEQRRAWYAGLIQKAAPRGVILVQGMEAHTVIEAIARQGGRVNVGRDPKPGEVRKAIEEAIEALPIL